METERKRKRVYARKRDKDGPREKLSIFRFYFSFCLEMLPLYAVRRTVGRVALLFTVKGQQLESMLLAHLSKP